MSELYFAKFPKMIYNGVVCTDITRNVQIDPATRNAVSLFYPYELKAGTRADVVADVYYEDPYYDWLIFLTNGIVDSHYGWYLDEDNFQNLIKSKYGSFEEAQQRVKEYRLNSNNDDIDISPAFHDNDLPDVLKKYYTPNYGVGSRVLSYRKRQDSWTAVTNQILEFEVTYNSNTIFANAELVTISNNLLPVGNAEVLFANSTTVIVKNISGNTSSNNVLTGRSSNNSANITQTSVLAKNIPDEEYVFWSPVSYYDYEYEKNESRRHIQLLDAGRSLEVAEKLRLKMKET